MEQTMPASVTTTGTGMPPLVTLPLVMVTGIFQVTIKQLVMVTGI
jgi:hypothetical protein